MRHCGNLQRFRGPREPQNLPGGSRQNPDRHQGFPPSHGEYLRRGLKGGPLQQLPGIPHLRAGHRRTLWFTRGFVEYQIPNFAPANRHITQITVSAELSSEAPGVNSSWPSDISFYINDVFVGIWVSPGDFGDVRGIFTPDWWYPNWNQYGLLKMLTVNGQGTFMDGLKISDVCISDLNLDKAFMFNLRFAVEQKAEHVGGLTIFGKSFGNYAQDIQVTLGYVNESGGEP